MSPPTQCIRSPCMHSLSRARCVCVCVCAWCVCAWCVCAWWTCMLRLRCEPAGTRQRDANARRGATRSHRRRPKVVPEVADHQRAAARSASPRRRPRKGMGGGGAAGTPTMDEPHALIGGQSSALLPAPCDGCSMQPLLPAVAAPRFPRAVCYLRSLCSVTRQRLIPRA